VGSFTEQDLFETLGYAGNCDNTKPTAIPASERRSICERLLHLKDQVCIPSFPTVNVKLS
jgi:hypothetical protein